MPETWKGTDITKKGRTLPEFLYQLFKTKLVNLVPVIHFPMQKKQH